MATEQGSNGQMESQMELHGDELLVVDDVKKYFPITRGIIFQKAIAQVQAVDGVSFSINPGETLGIVGESGLREVDARALHRAPAGNDRRAGSCSRGGTSRTSRARACVRSGAR